MFSVEFSKYINEKEKAIELLKSFMEEQDSHRAEDVLKFYLDVFEIGYDAATKFSDERISFLEDLCGKRNNDNNILRKTIAELENKIMKIVAYDNK